ncbi:MAG: S8 family serine peptidase [Ignavibacteriales bacterium]|nr:S8 family serine peptidase [Ignavibacteriales bacterium]
MRFRYLFLILFYSQIFAQTTIIIKYKSEESLKQNKLSLQNKLSDLTQNNVKDNSNNENKLVTLKEKFGKLNSSLDRIVKIHLTKDQNVNEIINSISKSSDIEYIQQLSNYKIDLLPDDSLYSEQWGLQSINAPKAWDLIPNDNQEILLAVIDTGIDYLHPDIENKIYLNSGEVGIDQNGNDKSENGIDDDENGFIDDYKGWDFVNKLDVFPIEPEDDFTNWDNDPMDEHGHGTNVSGIIAAEHNSFGIAGIDPNVKILNLRAFDKNGNGEEDDAASAIIYAVKMGAKVINMSWGDAIHSQYLKDVIEYAYENEVTLIASSGNNSSNLPHYPSSFPQVISVGAIQENEVLASYSNYGSTIDLVAPGSQILTIGLENTYKKVSGTSASAPFVSGAVSIIKSIKDFSSEEIKQILKSTTRDLGDNGWDTKYGAGTLNLEKALQILSPSEIKINFPNQEYATDKNKVPINITCISSYFQSFQLFYGIGYNPESWNLLSTGKENYQVYNEEIYNLDISKFQDTVYTIKLLVNKIDQGSLEERVNFIVDKTPPKVLNSNIFPSLLNDIENVHASIITDEVTSVKLFYRKRNSADEFKSIFLDGFASEVNMYSTNHFGVLPNEEVISGIDHEFYFEVINLAGLSTTVLDDGNYFSLQNYFENSSVSFFTKEYSLPNGRLYSDPVNFAGINEKFILLNENETSSNASIYKFSNSKFDKVNELQNRIPISVNDFNSDGKTDILNLFVKNGYIDSQSKVGDFEFLNSFSDSTQKFWPSMAEDIDNDGKIEIIVFSSDSTLTIWEVSINFELNKETELQNFVDATNQTISKFRNNEVLIGNFDSDFQNEILVMDNYGRVLVYQINDNSSYQNEKVIEHFFPIESSSIFAKGDFNGDGKLDIGIVSEFEENVFGGPLVYSTVINISNQEIDYLFQNMFFAPENNFVSSFQKKYRAINFSDINNDTKEELVIFTYPNSYIFQYSEKPKLLFYQTDVNAQSIFSGDLDENGIVEIGIPFGNKINFIEFIEDGKINPPVITDYYSIDSHTIYFEWTSNGNPVNIYKLSENQNWLKYSSTNENSFTDSVSSNSTNKYYIEFFDQNTNEIVSNKSKIIEIFAHAPGKLTNYTVNNNSILLNFNQPINSNDVTINYFLIDSIYNPTSAISSSENSILLTFNANLELGQHDLEISELKDIYNTEISDTIIQFEYIYSENENNKLFINNFEINNNNSISIIFNMKLDSITAINKINYIFSPNNVIEHIKLNNNKDIVTLLTKNPFGAIGKEYVLKIENLVSSIETGKIPISQNSGSEIVLTSSAENLDDIYVYPNPVNIAEKSFITFANLTTKVEIYVFSIDGKFINKIVENDGNGGVDWDLNDEKNVRISSGVYIYKAISLDNSDNKLQEKIGKFAVIK